MNSDRLISLLEGVKLGRPTDWPKLKTGLLDKGIPLETINTVFKPSRYTDSIYEVGIHDQAMFDRIHASLGVATHNTRKEKSVFGDTHKTNVDGALLVARTIDSPQPYCYTFGVDSPVPSPKQKHALLIENLECFLDIESTCRFVAESCDGKEFMDDVEFIWAAGNSVSNRLIIPYLSRFEGKVLCLFDVDLGGLRIFANLLGGGLSPGATSFITPANLEERLSASNRIAEDRQLDRLSTVYGVTDETDQIITLIRHYKRTIEQESYRANF